MKKHFNLNLVLYGSLFVDLVYILFGIALFQFPSISSLVIRVIFGLVIIITSIYAFVKYLAKNIKKNVYLTELIYGTIGMILGLFIIFQPIKITNIIVLSLALWLIISGIAKLPYVRKLIIKKEEIAPLILTVAAISIISGLIILIYPQVVLANLSRGMGLILVMYAIIDAMQALLFIKRAKELVKVFK